MTSSKIDRMMPKFEVLYSFYIHDNNFLKKNKKIKYRRLNYRATLPPTRYRAAGRHDAIIIPIPITHIRNPHAQSV